MGSSEGTPQTVHFGVTAFAEDRTKSCPKGPQQPMFGHGQRLQGCSQPFISALSVCLKNLNIHEAEPTPRYPAC